MTVRIYRMTGHEAALLARAIIVCEDSFDVSYYEPGGFRRAIFFGPEAEQRAAEYKSFVDAQKTLQHDLEELLG